MTKPRVFVAAGAAALLAISAVAACSSDDQGGPMGPTVDGGPDVTGADAAHDAVPDHTMRDAGVDATQPPPVDAGEDAAPDASEPDASDAACSNGCIDAPADSPPDSPVDVGVDTGVDAGVDASPPVDAGVDSAADAGSDAPAVDAGQDAEADAPVDAGCGATMALVGGSSTGAFGATWSAGAWTVQTLASSSVISTPGVVRFGADWGAAARANADALVAAGWAPSTWSVPAQIGAATTLGPPALSVLAADAHAVYRGSDSKFYHATYTTLNGWDNGSDPVGGSGGSQDFGPDSPTSATSGGSLYVAFAGNDSNLYVRPYDGTTWQSAVQVISGAALDSAVSPRIVAVTGGSADLLVVFSRSGDDALEYATRTAGAWSAAALVSGTTTFTPNPVSIAPTRGGGAYLLYQGSDGKPYASTYSGGAWTAPAALLGSNNPQLASPPQVAAGVCGDDAEAVYVLAQDSSVHVARVSGGAATDASPASVTGTYAAIATAP